MKTLSVSHRKRSRGVALITVMLIVALAAIIATQMNGRLLMQMQRSANIQGNQQAMWYAMGAEAFAKRVLIKAQEEDSDVTHLQQNWASGYQNFPVPNGEISGQVLDLQACLNLNALKGIAANDKSGTVKKLPARSALETLIVNLNIEGVSGFEAEYMADSLTDWLDSNDAIVSAGGAEDNDYASKEHPYLAANHYLSSVNELRMVEHFTPAVIRAIKPYVCILPQNNLHKVNINTIDPDKPQLLQALLNISEEEASDILTSRKEKGFESLEEFFSTKEMTSINLTEDQKQQFVVDSDYFKLVANANFSESYFSLNTRLQVLDKNQVAVLSRTIGRFNE